MRLLDRPSEILELIRPVGFTVLGAGTLELVVKRGASVPAHVECEHGYVVGLSEGGVHGRVSSAVFCSSVEEDKDGDGVGGWGCV